MELVRGGVGSPTGASPVLLESRFSSNKSLEVPSPEALGEGGDSRFITGESVGVCIRGTIMSPLLSWVP